MKYTDGPITTPEAFQRVGAHYTLKGCEMEVVKSHSHYIEQANCRESSLFT